MGGLRVDRRVGILTAVGIVSTVVVSFQLPWLRGHNAQAAVLDPPPIVPTPASISPAGRALAHGAALVEGTVTAITFSYDEARGPRTNVGFEVEQVYDGHVPSDQLTLAIFGGFLPDGRFVATSETPAFAEGQRCLMLLTSKSAFWSPIVPGYGFAIETVDGEDILIGDDGHPLMAIGVLGPRFGSDALFQGPQFDGRSFQRSVRLDAVPTHRAMRVAEAVAAIRAVAKADGLTLSGELGSATPPWSPWNALPVAGAQQ